MDAGASTPGGLTAGASPPMALAIASSRCYSFRSGLSIEFPSCCGQGRGAESAPRCHEDRICGFAASLQGSVCQIVELSATAEPEAAEKQEQDDDNEQQFHGLPSFAPRLHFLADGGRMGALALFASVECCAVG